MNFFPLNKDSLATLEMNCLLLKQKSYCFCFLGEITHRKTKLNVHLIFLLFSFSPMFLISAWKMCFTFFSIICFRFFRHIKDQFLVRKTKFNAQISAFLALQISYQSHGIFSQDSGGTITATDWNNNWCFKA